jgi:hypothetical protein
LFRATDDSGANANITDLLEIGVTNTSIIFKRGMWGASGTDANVAKPFLVIFVTVTFLGGGVVMGIVGTRNGVGNANAIFIVIIFLTTNVTITMIIGVTNTSIGGGIVGGVRISADTNFSSVGGGV